MDAELIAGEYRLPPDLWLEAAGFTTDALLPWPKMSTAVTACFRSILLSRSLLFFHLRDVAPLPDDFPVSASRCACTLTARYLPTSSCARFAAPDCTPAINLFTHYAEPVRPDGRMAEYLLRASHKHPTPMHFSGQYSHQ
ncbi:MAG: type VI secretion system baseplate subunit TssF [Escherichia sp.]